MSEHEGKPCPRDFPHLISREVGLSLPQVGQCDCACASVLPASPVPSAAPLTSGCYQTVSPLTVVGLTDDHHAVFSPYLRSCPVVLSRAALSLAQHFRRPRSLGSAHSVWGHVWDDETKRACLEQMIGLGVLLPQGWTPHIRVQAPTTVAVWLHITTACNLSCDYCYAPQGNAHISAATGQAVIDAVFRSALIHGLSAVKLKYAGGEPLLRFRTIAELHRYAGMLARRHNLELDGVILSNGTLLTEDIIEALQSLDLGLMISLDGLGRHHDCQRHFTDGRGSFGTVARSVELALSRGLVPDVSVTVSGRNAEGVSSLINWILERDLPFGVNFYRENELSASHTDLRLEEKRIIEGMLDAYSVIESRSPSRSLLASLADRANLSVGHVHTCGVGRNYLVFDHLGRVFKCQMDMDRPVSDVKDPDPLSTVRRNTNGVRDLEVDEKLDCRDCLWRYWCAGGCPLATYRATGRFDVKSPYCGIYRALFYRIMRLEGLRLLRLADEGGQT